MENLVLVFGVISIGAVLLSAYSMHLAVDAKIEVLAMKKSTHQVQLVPAESMSDWTQEEQGLNKAWNKGHGMTDPDVDGKDDDDEES